MGAARTNRGTARLWALAEGAFWIALCAGVIGFFSGCSGGSGSTGGGPAGGDPPLGTAALQSFASCDELRAAIVADAREKIAVQAENLRRGGWLAVRDGDVLVGAPGEPVPAPRPDEGGPSPGRSTDTNVQVPGVDEADVVETDGTRIWLLHGSELLVLASWPPEASALVSRTDIEGVPSGMFVAGGRAAVISQVYDSGELGGDDACAWIDMPFPRPLRAAFDAGIAFCAPTFTKITLLDVSGDAPRVTREIYLEGSYTAARRHGDAVRVVVQRGWGLPPGVPEPWSFLTTPAPPASDEELVQRVDEWESTAAAALEASALSDWLPAHRERVGGELVEVATDCSDAHVPAPGLSEHGATRIVALRMTEDAGDVEESLVLGGAQQVYASEGALLLAHPDWSWVEAGEPNDRTAIHAFAISSGSLETPYLASGFVPGTTLSQLAFDVRGDVIRVATTVSRRAEELPEVPPTTSRISTARVDGGSIAIVGSTGDLAPGERIFASRFLGDTAYLVTFRQIDPLFVVDLSDPASPTVLGEVEMPGFSEYLHPLGDGHLLTIGRDADLEGRTRGIALRIFDVTTPSAPRLAHVHLLPGEGWSAAEHDHLAFTFEPALGALAIPYSRYDLESYRTSLVVVGVDAAAGFTPLGEVDHERFTRDSCTLLPEPPCHTVADMRRGLFLDDFVYSISSGGMLVSPLSDLASTVAAVELPPDGGGFPVP